MFKRMTNSFSRADGPSSFTRRPNFLFIGPDKAGSTWLYKALGEHRDVYLPSVKELFFFDRFYRRGWRWYGSYFQDAEDAQTVVGELSHDYLFSPLACERIAADLPSVKMMVCLREPVQRAFSSYLYMVKQGRVRAEFDTAVREVGELIDHGRYATHLKRYLQAFDRDQIHVAVFDDLVEDSQRFFDEVCDFLGLCRIRLPQELCKASLPAARPRSLFWAHLARAAGWQIRRLGVPRLVARIKESAYVNQVLYSVYQRENKPEMLSGTKAYLRSVFLPEVRDLDAVLGSDFLTRWGYAGAAHLEKQTNPSVNNS